MLINALVIENYSIKGRDKYIYMYYIDSVQYKSRVDVSKGYFPAIGDTIPIVYEEGRPWNSRPLVPNWEDFEKYIGDSMPGINLKRILNDPIFRYVDVTQTDSSDNHKTFSYEFKWRGKFYRGKHSASIFQSPSVGDSIIVAYEDNNPANSVPLLPYYNVFKSFQR